MWDAVAFQPLGANPQHIVAVLIEIAAPYAQIVLMGYPELLSRTEKCNGSFYYMTPEVHALAELVTTRTEISRRSSTTCESIR